MDDRNAWDRSRARVHFVCGLIVGVLAGTRLFLDLFTSQSWPIGLLCVVAAALLCAWLAWRYLDDFWHTFLRWLFWRD